MMKKFLMSLAVILCLGTMVFCGAAQAEENIAKIETSLGTIMVRLDSRRAPETVKNFVDYARSGFYDGTIFHRVIKGFMIQGGGFTADLKQKPTRAPIKNESTLETRNARYTIAMARTMAPDSATAQFFINTKDNRFLDMDRAQDKVGYCVFGRVIQGKDVVNKIEAVKTSNKHFMLKDMPVEPVVIKKVTIMTAPE